MNRHPHGNRPSPRAIAGLSALALAAVTLTGCGGVDEAASGDTLATMEPIVLSLNEIATESSSVARGTKAFTEFITEKTDGKVSFEIYWAGSLVPYAEGLGATSTGIADISGLPLPYVTDLFPTLGWLLQAGAITGIESMNTGIWPSGFLAGHGAMLELSQTDETIQAEFLAQNVRPIYLGDTPTADLMCAKPIESLDDANGMRVRVNSPLWGDPATAAWGAVPVSFTSAEAYEAMQRGLGDCLHSPTGAVTYSQMGITEVAPYYVSTSGTSSPGLGWIINLDTWNSLPEDVQAIFDEGAALIAAEYAQTWIDGYAEFASSADALGVTIADGRALSKALKPELQAIVAGMAENAPSTVPDPEAYLAHYLDLREKWRGVIEPMGFDTTLSASSEDVLTAYLAGKDGYDSASFASAIHQVFID